MHIISGLGNGGAEKNLVRLIENMDNKKFDVAVVSLKNDGIYGQYLRDIGVNVICLELNKTSKIKRFLKLIHLTKKMKPDVIQTWMYHADFIGLLLGRLLGVKNVIWNIRSTKFNFEDGSWHAVIIRKICALLSFLPEKIINCSQISINEHIRIGYKESKFVYIPNGYDLSQLYFDRTKSLLKESNKLTIGIVGRNNPLKDFLNFFSALKIIAKEHIASQLKVVVVGRDVSDEYSKFIDEAYPIELSFWGECSDMLAVYNSFDFLALSSKSEAFPNVIAEAMACGKPCVSTDVGDAKIIIGDTGFVVSPSNHNELASGLRQMILLGSVGINELGKKARERIKTNYSLVQMVSKYEKLYSEIV